MTSPLRVQKMQDAIVSGDIERVRQYLKAGVPADAGVPDEGRTRPLVEVAALHGQTEIFQLLVEAGATPDRGPLLSQCVQTDRTLPMVPVLLAMGPLTAKQLNLASVTAALSGQAQAVEWLAAAGASTEAWDTIQAAEAAGDTGEGENLFDDDPA